MKTDLHTVLNEAAQHIADVRYTPHHILSQDGQVVELMPELLSVKEADKCTERFVRTFYPEHYKVLFE